MKNIFKKNQIIITALAIMIVIAGYLSFTNNDKPEDKDSVVTANPDVEGYDVLTGVDGLDLAQDTTGTDDTAADDTTDPTEVGTDETTDGETTAADENAETTADENDEEVPADAEDEDDTQELGDLSDEDILEAANDVTDTGELDIEEGVPGEAVLASTTLDGSFFITKRIEREQDRNRSKSDLSKLLEDQNLSDTSRQQIIDRMLEFTEISEKENNTELLLEAKGFADAMVAINEDGDVDVVINAPSLSDQQVAIIETIVMDQTNADIEQITINPVVVAE